jgi:Putative auto-transporter adhesin, head GIN domain
MGRSAANRAFLVGLGGFLLITSGCTRTVSGSGNVTSTPVPVSTFSRLAVSNAFDVIVSFGDQENVTLRVDDNIVGHLDVGVSDGTLHVGLESGTSVRDATLHADVTAQTLSSIHISGASQVHLSDVLSGERVGMVVSGAGRLDGTAQVHLATLELSGASNAKLSGSAGRLEVTQSGASQLDAVDLDVSELAIDLSGASTADVSVTGTISAGVSGASSLRYRGSPTFTRREVSGGSSIEPA